MELTIEKESLEKEVAASAIVQYAESLQIKSYEDTALAQSQLQEIKRRQKIVKDRLEPIRENQHKAWKGVCNLITDLLKPLEAAESMIKKKCIAFDDEQRRKQEEAARRAEAQRQEEERKKQEKLEAQAKKAEEKGQIEKAEALREQKEAVAIAPQFIPPPPPTAIKGSSFRKTWKGEVTDMVALCRAIAEGKASPNLVMANMPAINAHAKANKDTWPLAGVRFFEETDMSVRASA